MKCMYCNTEVPASFKCCHNCGQPLARSLDTSVKESNVRVNMLINVYCVNCLTPLPENARFCPKCGLNLNSRNGYPIDSEGNPTTTKPKRKRDPIDVEGHKTNPGGGIDDDSKRPGDDKDEQDIDTTISEQKKPPKKDRLMQVFLFLCAIGICILVTGLGGKIATGSLAEEIQNSGMLKEIEQGYGTGIAESMGDVANEFVIALMRNEPSRFSKKLMGFAGSELGELGTAITGLSDMAVAEMFRVVRGSYSGSDGIWFIFQASAYYPELLIAGAIIAVLFGLLWLIRRNRTKGKLVTGKAAVVTVSIVTICWIIIVILCTSTAVSAL